MFRKYSPEVQEQLIGNLAADLEPVAEQTKLLAICNFYRADAELGKRLAAALNVDLTPFLSRMS